MSQESTDRQPPPEIPPAEEPPAPPEELKPWYYQYWFLHPMFVFWPLWPVLIIRSPWHNGMIMGAVAWAWLIVGGGLVFFRLQAYFRDEVAETVALSTVAIIAPGLLFTLAIQAHWITNRRRILARTPNESNAAAAVVAPPAQRPRSGRARRRRNRRS